MIWTSYTIRLLSLLSLTLSSWGLPQLYPPGPELPTANIHDPQSEDHSIPHYPITTGTATSALHFPSLIASGFVPSGASPTSTAPAYLSNPTANPNSTITAGNIPINNGFLRGVNIGGWLVLEKWMNNDVFTGAGANAADQFNFDSTDGAAQGLEEHWSSWFTEADVQSLKSYGINA